MFVCWYALACVYAFVRELTSLLSLSFCSQWKLGFWGDPRPTFPEWVYTLFSAVHGDRS